MLHDQIDGTIIICWMYFVFNCGGLPPCVACKFRFFMLTALIHSGMFDNVIAMIHSSKTHIDFFIVIYTLYTDGMATKFIILSYKEYLH